MEDNPKDRDPAATIEEILKEEPLAGKSGDYWMSTSDGFGLLQII